MKLLLVLVGIVVVVSGEEYCFNAVDQACKPTGFKGDLPCTARYGEINVVENDLKGLANKLINHNFDYMLLATHFNNYKMNRAGFTKLFRKLSDTAWEDSIDLIKYMAKRGVAMDFEEQPKEKKAIDQDYALSELESLAKSLDIQKSLATRVHEIHHSAAKDAEVMSHLENTFAHKLRDSIRELSGHTNDLSMLISHKQDKSPVPDYSLNVFLFDEYLSKLY